MSLIGFKCKKCDRPFFMMFDNHRNLIDCAAEIKRYEKRGFVLEEVQSENIHDLCTCKYGKVKDKHR